MPNLETIEHALISALGVSDWFGMATVLLIGMALGAVHTLLPGHGKTLLATQSATREPQAQSKKTAILQAVTVAFMRSASAIVLVVGGGWFARTFLGSDLAPAGHAHDGDHGIWTIVGGCIFVGLGLWLISTAMLARQGRANRFSDWPIYGLGVLPDPVATTILLTAFVLNRAVAGFVAVAGIAVGMSITLSIFAFAGTAAMSGESGMIRNKGRSIRFAGGLIVMATGVSLIFV